MRTLEQGGIHAGRDLHAQTGNEGSGEQGNGGNELTIRTGHVAGREVLIKRQNGQGDSDEPDSIVRSQHRRFGRGLLAGAISDTQARVATRTVQIDPFAVMVSAKQLPTEHFADYSFVF